MDRAREPCGAEGGEPRPAPLPPVIGGVLGLEEPPDAPPAPGGSVDRPPSLREPALWLADARSALALLVDELRPARVHLPALVCEAVVEAVRGRAEVVFHPLAEDLVGPAPGALADVASGELVVAVDWLGFRTAGGELARARARGAVIVEDASQTLWTEGAGADFVVHSPRKVVGVPDGGILRATGARPLPRRALAPPPEPWWSTSLAACRERAAFDRARAAGGAAGERSWFALFRRAEAAAPVGAFATSALTRRLLAGPLDWAEIARRRRANWLRLRELLAPAVGAELALPRPELPADVVPLGFPVRLARREDVRVALFAREIFPPVHWPIEGVVPARFEREHALARELATLPCDQRYDAGDMERVARFLIAALHGG